MEWGMSDEIHKMGIQDPETDFQTKDEGEERVEYRKRTSRERNLPTMAEKNAKRV